MYKVTIPGNFNNTQFCSNNLLKTIDEAKYEAANFVLSKIFEIDDTNADILFSSLDTSFSSRPLLYANPFNSNKIIVENASLNSSISTVPSISHQSALTNHQVINGEIPTIISTMPTQYFVD
jgi:hypothetical protein